MQVQRFRQAAAQLGQLLGKGVDLRVLRARGFGGLLRHAQAQRLELLDQLVAQRAARFGQLRGQGAARFGHLLGHRAAQLRELRGQRVHLRVLRAQRFGALAGDGVLKARQRLRQLLAATAGAVANLVAQLALQPFAALANGLADQLLHLAARSHVFGPARAAHQQQHQQNGVEQQRGQGKPDKPVGWVGSHELLRNR